jgi:hypothetical protein
MITLCRGRVPSGPSYGWRTMTRIPSLTSGRSDLLMFISGLALVGYLLIVAPVARPNIASHEGNFPVAVMTASSKHTTVQEELRTPLQEEPRPLSRLLPNDLRWYLLASAATSRNRYPSPFATQTMSDEAAARHGRKLVIPAGRALPDRLDYG